MNRAVHCQDCEWTGNEDDTSEIKDFVERHEAGDVVAAGECPKCGALAMLTEPPKFIEVHGGVVTEAPSDCELIDWDNLLPDGDGPEYWGTAASWSLLSKEAQKHIETAYPDEYAKIVKRLTPTPPAVKQSEDRAQWVSWLSNFGLGEFYDAFLRNAQGAKGTCIHCEQDIYLDIVEGGGVPDWKTEDGDYGCFESPETNSEGTGSHFPERLEGGAS